MPKRFNLVIEEDLFARVEQEAIERNTSTTEVIKSFLRLGLLASEIAKDPNRTLIIREGKKKKEVVFLF